MNRDFFIRLTFAAHRVVDVLEGEDEIKLEIKNSANALLADLILFSEKEIVPKEKKKSLIPSIVRRIDNLLALLNGVKQEGRVNPKNFSVLETEYGNLRELLEMFHEVEALPVEIVPKEEAVKEKMEEEREEKRGEKDALFSERQKKILEFLQAKRKVQVWELQKVLPQVTKRTLRRDLDDLLQVGLIQRKGEWNAVFYELKENTVEKV